MGTTMKCADCAMVCDSNDGYLRPEGFLCGDCYRRRCKDPAYVAEMESQLTGLLSTLAVASGEMSGLESRKTAPLVPTNARDRIACESVMGLSVGDALGARFEGHRLDITRLNDSPMPSEPMAWTDDTQMALGIVETLIEHGEIDQDRLAGAFGRRYEPWRGYGPGMHVVLPELRRGRDWRGLKDKAFRGGSFGNGSAMRVAPLGAYFHDAAVDTVVLTG